MSVDSTVEGDRSDPDKVTCDGLEIGLYLNSRSEEDADGTDCPVSSEILGSCFSAMSKRSGLKRRIRR